MSLSLKAGVETRNKSMGSSQDRYIVVDLYVVKLPKHFTRMKYTDVRGEWARDRYQDLVVYTGLIF